MFSCSDVFSYPCADPINHIKTDIRFGHLRNLAVVNRVVSNSAPVPGARLLRLSLVLKLSRVAISPITAFNSFRIVRSNSDRRELSLG